MSVKAPLKAEKLPIEPGIPLPVNYPVLTSPKIDGIRCLQHPDHGGAVTIGKFNEVPNRHIHETLNDDMLVGLDGELVVRDPKDGRILEFNAIQSGVMSRSGTPNFEFIVFDSFLDPEAPYTERLKQAYNQVSEYRLEKGHQPENRCVRVLPQKWTHDERMLLADDKFYVSEGWEGTMIRDPNAFYKQGRSTLKQGYLLKLKRFYDAEGIVIDVEELRHNKNEATTDVHGYTTRSSHKANKVPADTMGALVLKTEWGSLRVGTGFDATQRQLIWDTREAQMGRAVTFRYQGVGMKNLPRFPSFLRFREGE